VAAVRARWSSSSFLLYAGGLTILFAVLALLGTLSDDYEAAGFAGWSIVAFGLLALLAWLLRRRGEAVGAGLFALASVAAFGVVVGSVENWLGWLADTDSPFEGFHPGNLLLALVVLVAALVALRLFHFPLLVLVGAAAGWYFLTDLLSNGGDLAAATTIFYGVLMLLVAFAAGPVYGFWLHVAAGVSLGGAALYFWHTSHGDWLLVAFASLVYIGLAARLGRSSYAVLGTIGLFLVTAHFAESWFDLEPFFFFFGASEGGKAWAQALAFCVLGLALMVLGLLLARVSAKREAAP
jgi:hypothetical protein